MGNTFKTGNYVNAIFQDSSNNVGIGGAPSGSYKFDVTGTGRFTGALTAAGLTSTGAISLTPSSFAVGSSTAVDANSLTLQAANSNYQLRFKNTAGTSVGGFYYDGTYLVADSTYKFANAVTLSTGALFTANASIISSDNSILAYTNSYMYIQGNSAGGLWLAGGSSRNANIAIRESSQIISFYTNGNENMILTGAGNVSIGQVPAPSNVKLKVRVSDQSTSNYAFIIDNSIWDLIEIRNDGWTNFVGKKVAEVFTITNSRNASGDYGLVTSLGSNCNNTGSYHYIATTGGADKFYVYGNGNVVNANGSYGTLSDVKLKENIVDATPKLGDLLKLKVRNFNLIDDETKTKQIGFIAQEFEEVFPAMVDWDEKTEKKTIKTSILVPMLVKAIQEQNQLINELKAELKDILKRNNLS